MQITLKRSALALTLLSALNTHAADDAVIVTATRFPGGYGDQPVNMTVISAEQIQRSPARTLPDLLAEQVGVQSRDLYGNNGAAASVDMRGFGATAAQNTLILVDGRRVNDIDQSGVQWAAVPLANIERVEILRGAGGVLYGEGATAGVINIITRTPINASPEARVEGLMGSYGTLGKSLSGQLGSEGFGLAMAAQDFKSDGYRDNNKNEQSNVSADARWQLPFGTLTAKLAADRQELRLPAGRQIRPSTGLDQYSTDRRGARTPQDYSSRDGNQALLDFIHPTTWGDFNVGLGYRNKDQKSFFAAFGGTYTATNLDVVSVMPKFRIRHRPWDMPVTWVIGADWYGWDYGRKTSNALANIGRPINRLVAGQENMGVYLSSTVQLNDRLKGNFGVRNEVQKMRADDTYDPTAPGAAASGAPKADHSDGETSYEAGLRYQLNEQSTITGRFGKSFRFANVDEIYESNAAFTQEFQFLRPQRARSAELALEQRWTAFNYRIALFRMDVTDEIHLDPYLSAGVGNRNLPPSRRQGAELEASWSISDAWSMRGAYAHTSAKFKEGVFPGNTFGIGTNLSFAGKTVPLVPRHKLNLSTTWKISPSVNANFGIVHVAKQYMDNDEINTMIAQIPAYTLADFKLSYLAREWDLRFSVNNVFNRKYYNYAVRGNSTVDLYEVYPLPERSFTLSAAYRFR